MLVSGLIVRKKRTIASKEIRSILINRTDRLGDAVISLPFLMELSKRFEITVLTSGYNDFILRDFLKTRVFIEEPPTFFKDVMMILGHSVHFRTPGKKTSAPEYDLYLGLTGIRGLNIFLKAKKQNLCRYYADFNLGPWNLLLDYAAPGNPVLFAKTHILDSYRQSLKKSLNLNLDVPDYVDFGSRAIKPKNLNIEEPYILVNILGFNRFRGPTPGMFAEILNQIGFAGTIVVMDELGQPNLEEFKKHIRKSEIIYLEEDYTAWELLYLSRHSLLYIGSDSGITQFLEKATNSLIFFGNGSFLAWGPYSKNDYQRKKAGGLVIGEARNSAGLVKKIIYRPVWCRPCFDIGCRTYRCISRINTGMVASEIDATLNKNLTPFR